MPRYIDANKAIELLRAYKTSGRPNAYEQGINRGIKLACWILSDNRVLQNVNEDIILGRGLKPLPRDSSFASGIREYP